MEELTKNQSKRCRACAFGEVGNESTVFCPFGRCAAKRLQRYGKKKNHSRAVADKGDAGAGGGKAETAAGHDVEPVGG